MTKFQIAELITTFFYIGKIKYAPGTLGSLAAYPLAIGIIFLTVAVGYKSVGDIIIFVIPIILILVCCVLFFVGVYFSSIYIEHVGHEDPKEIVIDEVVGQLLTITLCIPIIIFFGMQPYPNYSLIAIFSLCGPLILFRLFDIFKPWPINWIDRNVKKGLGVMLDDVVAAIFAVIAYYIILIY